jgi:hypothetical protein
MRGDVIKGFVLKEAANPRTAMEPMSHHAEREPAGAIVMLPTRGMAEPAARRISSSERDRQGSGEQAMNGTNVQIPLSRKTNQERTGDC